MPDDGQTKIAGLIANPPRLHFWDGDWRVGGMGRQQLELLLKCVEHVSASGNVIGVETGAGLSTLVLLARGVALTSFFVDEGLERRIDSAIETYGLDPSLWSRRVGYSEFTLPAFAQQVPSPQCNFVLIDGGHGVHTVFTDYTYAFAVLKRGGIVLIDDVQLPSCGLLHGILKSDRKVRQFAKAGKLVAYEKLTEARMLTDWASPVCLKELENILNLPKDSSP